MLRPPFYHENPGMRAPSVYWRAVVALACAFCLAGCDGRQRAKLVDDKTVRREQKVVEVQETKGLSDSGDIVGAVSWSPGDDLEVWYRDAGANILLATRSTGRVLIHVDVNRDGIPESGQDRVYAFGPDLSIHAQYSRPVWATAAWDVLKTSASVEIRNRAVSSTFTLWRLPKEELGLLQDGTDLTFEVFDERYQISAFRPGKPFDAVVRLKYSKSSAKGATTKQAPPNGNANGKLATGGSVLNPRSPTNGVKTLTPVPPPAITSFQGEPGSIERGGSTILRWSVTGSTGVRIDPGIGILPSQGEKMVSPDQTTPYILTAEGPGGTASNQITVHVVSVQPPSITSFQAEPGLIERGGTAFLRWSVTGNAKVRIDPGIGALPLQGERAVSPERNTQYTLTAEGPSGAVSSQFTVRVAQQPPPPPPPPPTPPPGKNSGEIVWEGNIKGTELITIEDGQASSGTVSGALPGVLCLLQPADPKRVSIASTPAPYNQYKRMVFRVSGNGRTRVVIRWSLP